MLDLDSDSWSELRHAYGPASDIPARLRDLPTAEVKSSDPKREPWFSLWSALCHQSDVYVASYAAVPHIIHASLDRKPEDRAEYLVLAGSIETLRHMPGAPRLSPNLDDAYAVALQRAVAATLEALAQETDTPWVQGLLSALAAFRGFPQLASGIAELSHSLECPSCEATFVAPGFDSIK